MAAPKGNKYAKGNKGGRPLAFKSEEELQAAIDDYFEEETIVTMAGLAFHLGIDRQTLYNYEKKQEYFDIIKKARNRILIQLEKSLMTEGKAGQIFLAKNYGYTDKQEMEHTGEVGVTVKWK